jgi:hypothetical protein
MKLTLPSPELVSRNYSDLLGRTFAAKKAPQPFAPKPGEKWAVARYGAGTPGSAAVVYWLVDLPAAAGLGAALSMIPSATAQAAARDGKFSEALLENFREVMNVGAAMLKSAEGRVALQDVLLPPQPPAAELAKWMASAQQRMDLTTALQGYDAGRIVLLLVPPAP